MCRASFSSSSPRHLALSSTDVSLPVDGVVIFPRTALPQLTSLSCLTRRYPSIPSVWLPVSVWSPQWKPGHNCWGWGIPHWTVYRLVLYSWPCMVNIVYPLMHQSVRWLLLSFREVSQHWWWQSTSAIHPLLGSSLKQNQMLIYKTRFITCNFHQYFHCSYHCVYTICTKAGETALILACKKEDLRSVQLLLKENADANHRTKVSSNLGFVTNCGQAIGHWSVCFTCVDCRMGKLPYPLQQGREMSESWRNCWGLVLILILYQW